MKCLAAIAALIASPVSAEIVHSDNHGFEVTESVQLSGSPTNALTSFTQVSAWWPRDHTYSGDPANLSLETRPGGCFCERFPGGGGIEHLHVTYFEPGQYLILTGAMGPLLHEAVNGVMNVHVEKSGGGTRLTLDYRTSGFANGGGVKFAGMVDRMLSGTLERYRAYAEAAGKRP